VAEGGPVWRIRDRGRVGDHELLLGTVKQVFCRLSGQLEGPFIRLRYLHCTHMVLLAKEAFEGYSTPAPGERAGLVSIDSHVRW
jgi:hypothetical protein